MKEQKYIDNTRYSLLTICTAFAIFFLQSFGVAYSAERIQFSDIGIVKEWKGSNALVFVKRDEDQWYRAQLNAACMKYDTASGIRFITEAGENSQRVSKVMVGRRICTVTSLTKIEALPMEN